MSRIMCILMLLVMMTLPAFADGDGRTSPILDDQGKPFTGTRTDHFNYSASQQNHYKDGYLDGICQAFDSNGRLLFERKFVKGKVVAYRAVAPGIEGPHKWTKLKQ